MERLETVQDVHLLKEILGLLDMESKERILKIPDHYKQKLNKSINQKKAGDTIPNHVVEESTEKMALQIEWTPDAPSHLNKSVDNQ